jgi:hypothetical protein
VTASGLRAWGFILNIFRHVLRDLYRIAHLPATKLLLFLGDGPYYATVDICGSAIRKLILGWVVALPYNGFLYNSSHDRHFSLLGYEDYEEVAILCTAFLCHLGPRGAKPAGTLARCPTYRTL